MRGPRSSRFSGLRPLPVRYIVTTHWHPDHWAGNGEFVRVYPGVSIIPTENTGALSQSHGAPYIEPEYPGKILEAIRRALARGTDGDGKPHLAIELPYIEMVKIQFQSFGPELETLRIAA